MGTEMMAGDIDNFLSIPRAERNPIWVERFFETLPLAPMWGNLEKGFEGPDGLFYMALFSSPKYSLSGSSAEEDSLQNLLFQDVLKVAIENGCGLAINPHKQDPDWIFTYGHLWSQHSFGKFDLSSTLRNESSGKEDLEDGAEECAEDCSCESHDHSKMQEKEILIIESSEEIFPEFARNVIRKFLDKNLGLVDQGYLVFLEDENSKAPSLMFSIFAEDFDDEEHFEAALMMLDWHLPPHYELHACERDAAVLEKFSLI